MRNSEKTDEWFDDKEHSDKTKIAGSCLYKIS